MKAFLIFINLIVSYTVYSQNTDCSNFHMSTLSEDLIYVSIKNQDTITKIFIKNYNDKPIYITCERLYEGILNDSVSDISNISWEENPNYTCTFRKLKPNESVTLSDKLTFNRVRLKIEYFYSDNSEEMKNENIVLNPSTIKYPFKKIILSNYY